MATILVTDGEERASLAIVRSLGRAGHRVLVASRELGSLAGASCHAVAEEAAGDALADPAQFCGALVRLCKRCATEVLIPVTDASLAAVAPRRERFGSVIIPFPDASTLSRAIDKEWLMEAATREGLRVPDQIVVRSPADAGSIESLASDAVLKPARSIKDGHKLSVSYLSPNKDPAVALRQLPAAAFPLLVQKRIRGPGIGIFLLRWEGRVLAAFQHRRVREKPPSGGVSVVRESVPLEPDALDQATRLLDLLDWRGPAMVEFKMDESSGELFFMEINGRFWGSLQLAIDAGVDFPRLLVEAALGEAVERDPEYEIGVRSRWLMGDLDHLISRLRHSRGRLNLAPSAPGRLRSATTFLGDFLRPHRLEILRYGDLSPFARELRLWLKDLMTPTR